MPKLKDSSMTHTIKTTTLHALHQQHGARLVAFAGYHLPIQYQHGIKHEHLHTRQHASLFDVSHMGQIQISGADVLAGLQHLVPSDLDTLPTDHSRYSVLTNAAGGVLDDLIITPRTDGVRLIVNAACKQQDVACLRQHFGTDAAISLLDDHDLLALQGPAAAGALRDIIPAVDALRFMQAGQYHVNGVELFITRSGYTGEDGFEISLPNSHTQPFVEQLLCAEAVRLAGLGARDSLRLEAGLCLYGQDLTPDITPVEAGLGWLIAKKYRADEGASPCFPGAELLLRQLAEGVEKVRVGLRVSGRIPVRAGATVTAADGAAVGRISSGGYGPTVAAPIAMAYVPPSCARPGTALYAEVRHQRLALTVVPLPFVEHRYHTH